MQSASKLAEQLGRFATVADGAGTFQNLPKID